MEFRKEVKTVEFLSPRLGFAADMQSIEYREDPLTGAQSRLNLARSGRVRQAQQAELGSRQAVEETRADCFFCPENLESDTPMFPTEFYRGGRIRRGESVVFPNLFPFGEYHAVGTMTESHYLQLDGFTPRMVMDNLMATVEYVRLVHEKDGSAQYPLWIWNYLPPSGASIIHPHVQIMVDRAPPPELERMLQQSQRYQAAHGGDYWHDLIEEERRKGERFIGEKGSVVALASYAPRGNTEVHLLFTDIGNLGDLEERQAWDFASAVVGTLRCYHEMGVDSFNVVTYSAAVGENPDYYRLNARIVSRPAFRPWYTSDCGFMERFFDVWVIETLPEDVARAMREWF